jgi:hypothetical protein
VTIVVPDGILPTSTTLPLTGLVEETSENVLRRLPSWMYTELTLDDSESYIVKVRESVEEAFTLVG